jgi:hypothetical protein
MSHTTAQAKVYCKAGREIDNARILKYEGFYRKIIRDFLPGLCLVEAAMSYDDLLNQLRYEAFMAIKNGFDPIKAMDSSIKDPEKRAIQIQKKLNNPEKALEQAEKNMVYGRLVNYMRRTRWKYHPDQRGGRTVSLNATFRFDKADQDDQDTLDVTSFEVKMDMNRSQAELDRAALIKAMNDGRNVREIFMQMSEERREDLLGILETSPQSKIRDFSTDVEVTVVEFDVFETKEVVEMV